MPSQPKRLTRGKRLTPGALTAARVKQRALELGADLAGIASADKRN